MLQNIVLLHIPIVLELPIFRTDDWTFSWPVAQTPKLKSIPTLPPRFADGMLFLLWKAVHRRLEGHQDVPLFLLVSSGFNSVTQTNSA